MPGFPLRFQAQNKSHLMTENYFMMGQQIMATRSHFLSSRVIYSVLFFVLLVMLLIVTKPSFAFAPDGSVKPFGVGEGKTVFSLGTMVGCMAIICFYVFCLIDIVLK